MRTDNLSPDIRQPDGDDFAYTVPEVAKKLKIAESTLYRHVKRGAFPAVKIGRYWRITQRQLDEYLHGEEEKEEAG